MKCNSKCPGMIGGKCVFTASWDGVCEVDTKYLNETMIPTTAVEVLDCARRLETAKVRYNTAKKIRDFRSKKSKKKYVKPSMKSMKK